MIKTIWDVEIGDTINGCTVVGRGKQGKADEYYLLVMNKIGHIQTLVFELGISFMIDDYMTDPEPDLKWGGEIVMGKLSRHELVWHKTSDALPPTDGRYLVCTNEAQWPIIAEAAICQFATGHPVVIWSRLIKGTRERIAAEVYWWAEIPLPVDES